MLDKLLEQAIESLKLRGTKVYLAKTREDAINYILKELEGEKLVVKSKTNTAKEIGLVKQIEKQGIEIIETDIGDRIIQISGEMPSVPIGPAVHLDPKFLAEILETH